MPESFVVNIGDGRDEDVLFATKRYDRVAGAGSTIGRFKAPLRLHQEDFSQALDKATKELADAGFENVLELRNK